MQLNELYQTVILEHYKFPHNKGELANADVESRGYNESCGDDVRLFLLSYPISIKWGFILPKTTF